MKNKIILILCFCVLYFVVAIHNVSASTKFISNIEFKDIARTGVYINLFAASTEEPDELIVEFVPQNNDSQIVQSNVIHSDTLYNNYDNAYRNKETQDIIERTRPSDLSQYDIGKTWKFTISSLQEDTVYNLQFTVDYNDLELSGYSDYDDVTGKIVSQPVTFSTMNLNTRFNVVDKRYVLPGEILKIYGENFTHVNAANVYLKYWTETTHNINRNYNLILSSWGDNRIDVVVPAYDPDKYSTGLINIDRLTPNDQNYNTQQLFVTVINDYSQMPRTIPSGYQNEDYRYLINASNFRYNTVRTSHTFIQERAQMGLLSGYLHRINHGVDALWAIVLSNSIVYGGYRGEEVEQEINHGPGCVHATIKQDVWSQTQDYQDCMAR